MLKRQGLLAIAAILGLFIILHLGITPDGHSSRATGATLLGGVAFLMMTWAVVLSTRLRMLEDLFGGLDRMYQVHKILGTTSGLLVLIHFFAAPKDLPQGADPAVNALVPSAPMGMLAMIFLVIGLAMALNRKIAYHRWRPAHKAMVVVYVLVLGHMMTAPTVFFERFSASGLILVAAGIIGIIAMGYSLFGMNRKTALPYEIVEVNAMERATEVVLKPLGPKMAHKAGQFAFVEVEGKDWNEPHPFTISSAPNSDELRFTMKVLGDWTRRVREDLIAGQKVAVRGPYGRFDATAAGPNQIWIAGGIGLTPFLSKLRDMTKGDPRDIHLVYACRNKDEALFLAELQERAAELGNVKVSPLYSEDGDFARVDMIQHKLPNALTDYDYFMCGPKPMIDAITRDLHAQGVTKTRIHTEAFEFR